MKFAIPVVMVVSIMIAGPALAGGKKKVEQKDPRVYLEDIDRLTTARDRLLGEMYIKKKELETLEERLNEIMIRIRVRNDAERKIREDESE